MSLRERLLEAIEQGRVTYVRAGAVRRYRIHFPAEKTPVPFYGAMDRAPTASERRVLGALAAERAIKHLRHAETGEGVVRPA